MGQMIEVARSSVQTWKCDQMGHMNVQFYVAKAEEGLSALAAALGLSARAQADNRARLIPRDIHIRFHRELRPGAPYRIAAGVLEAQSEGLVVYLEMQNAATSELAATFVERTEWCDVETRGGLPLPTIAVARASHHMVELPTQAGPRGLVLSPARPAPWLVDAERLGLITTLRGVVLPEHCDGAGFMKPSCYVGRVSDAIPNLIAQTRGEDRSTGTVGGAALEYRFVYRAPAREDDLLVIKSGLKGVGAKVYSWVHWLFDAETGDCLATAEAVAIALDLLKRKAIDIPLDMRTKLERLVVPDLSA